MNESLDNPLRREQARASFLADVERQIETSREQLDLATHVGRMDCGDRLLELAKRIKPRLHWPPRETPEAKDRRGAQTRALLIELAGLCWRSARELGLEDVIPF